MEHIKNDQEPVPGGTLVPTPRHDGFTPKRRRTFLKTLRKTGCVRDACRAAGISDSAAYKARKRDPELRALWDIALSRAGSDIETLAWQRAVDGVEEEVWAYGKLVGARRKRDPQLFRMLLQASNPARYGGQGYGSRKALEKRIRAQIEEERRELEHEDIEEVRERLANRIERLRRREIDSGRFREEGGNLIPIGYVKAPDADATVPARPETDAGVREGDADWTEPEPPRGAAEPGSDVENPRFSDESPHLGPRVTRLEGW